MIPPQFIPDFPLLSTYVCVFLVPSLPFLTPVPTNSYIPFLLCTEDAFAETAGS